MSRTRLPCKAERLYKDAYRSWCNMRNRINNPKDKMYYLYGGRGIKIDPKWNNFYIFLKDMGMPPKDFFGNRMSLDRKDSNKDYTKDNCQWATKEFQNSNREYRGRA